MTILSTLKTPLILALAGTVLLGLSACGSGASEDHSAASTPAESPTAAESPAASEAEAATEELAFEPAYPEDVSDEGLSEHDRDQQRRSDHSHEDGTTHSHGDEEDHSHGGGGSH